MEKPEQTDFYDVDVFNTNADIIDEELSKSVKGEGIEFSITDNTLNATHESGATAQIADKPTVDEILALLENTTYGLNALKSLISSKNVDLTPIINRLDNTTYGLSALNTDIDNVQSTLNNTTYGLSAIKNYVDTLESVIGTTANTGGSASAGTVMAKLNALFGVISSSGGIPGTVKSTQRGIINGGYSDLQSDGGIYYLDVTIQSVNINKAVVVVSSSNRNVNASDKSANARLINSTTLRVYVSYTDSQTFHNVNWQVIDFY